MAMRELVYTGLAAMLLGAIASADASAAPSKKGRSYSRPAIARAERVAPPRPRTRIEIYGSRAPLHRDCRAVFDERWIPEWGGRVLYAGQDCWWTRD